MAKPKKQSPKELYWARKHREEAEKAALLPPGLVNHGNTCFMNSVLQGLIATDLLEELVLFRPSSQPFVQPSASRRSPLIVNGRGPDDIRHEWVQGMAIGDVFLHTLERAWRMRDAKERSSMSPKELLSRLGHKYDQYLDFRQQDAHEFILHLLDGMRMEEFDVIKSRQPQPSPKSSKRRAREPGIVGRTDPAVTLEEDRPVSFVDVLWGGKFTSFLICATCNHVSHTYEDFDDLSLSITHDESKERKRDRLRAFASKFMSQSSRSRDQGQPRPQSASQPPSPPFPRATLEPMEEGLEQPRRRSCEDNLGDLSPVSTAERRKVEIISGVRHSEDGSKETATQPFGLLSQKVSDVGLGRLGRRISVGMSLNPRKERKLERTDKDQTIAQPNIIKLNGKSSEPDEDGPTFMPVGSKPTSRQPSPGPANKHKGLPKQPKPSAHAMREAAYLRRLLEDTTFTLSNPLAVLRMTNSNASHSSSAWAKISSTQGVEDCLKMFTAVEALDGDNMFGCRNCWKIANGQAPIRTNSQSDDEDSDDSSHTEERHVQDSQLSSSQSLGPAQRLSMPNPPHTLSDDHEASILSTSMSSWAVPTPADQSSSQNSPSMLELNAGQSPSTSITSLGSKARTNGFGPHNNLVGLVMQEEGQEEGSSMRLSTGESRSRGPPIPTIATISPPPESSTSDSSENRLPYGLFPSKLNEAVCSSRDSLRLPEVRFRHRLDNGRDGESSISSEESERDDTSGVSDGDTSAASVPRSVNMRRPRRPSLPRSKQVIYRRALKRYLIARPPPILVIHLKRFQQVSKSPVTLFGHLKKLDDYVPFLEYLDIRPFLAPKKEDYGLGKGELKGKVVEKGRREEDQPCVYRLYSVVVHIGNMLGGHYIAYTALPPSSNDYAASSTKDDPGSRERKPATQSGSEKGLGTESNKQERQWAYISDTIVRLVSLEEVLKAKAYLCMYERIQ